MPQQPHRDNRYRGRARRVAPPQRKPGHLRTNYSEDDLCQFNRDMAVVRSVWPEEVRKGDSRAVRKKELKASAIVMVVIMVPLTALAVWFVIDTGAPWWIVPAAQTAFLLYFAFMMFVNNRGNRDEDIGIIIRREADRRGITYTRATPLYALMNRINADYNSYLWNRNFKWK